MVTGLRRLWVVPVVALLAVGGLVALGMKRARAAMRPPRTTVLDTPSGVEDVFFTTDDGLKLRGWYFPSKNRAAVVLGHGHGTNRAELLPEALALSAAGFGVLAFDWRAHGESEGAWVTYGFLERKDLTAALNLVSQRPDVDPKRIGALGFSRGGTVVLEVAAVDPRIRAVVVESTAVSARTGLCRDFGQGPLGCFPVTWAFALQGIDVDATRAIDRICKVSPRPVFVLHGDADPATPVDDGRALFAAACDPKEQWIVPGVGHGGYARVPGYLDRITAFFTKNL